MNVMNGLAGTTAAPLRHAHVCRRVLYFGFDYAQSTSPAPPLYLRLLPPRFSPPDAPRFHADVSASPDFRLLRDAEMCCSVCAAEAPEVLRAALCADARRMPMQAAADTLRYALIGARRSDYFSCR